MSADRASVDVCVIGAGPAGATAAAVSAAAGLSVVLVDGGSGTRPGLELLSGRAASSLDRIGVLDEVRAAATACTGTISRWGTDDFLVRPSLMEPWGGGWIVDRGHVDHLLVGAAVAAGALRVRGRARRIDDHGSGLRVQLGPDVVRARRVIVATGGLGKLGGARIASRELPRGTSWPMLALVATLPPDIVLGLGHHLLVDRAANGWWYAMSSPTATTLAYCTDADLVGAGRAGVMRTWERACREFAWVPRAARDVHPSVRSQHVGHRHAPSHPAVEVVGDAAFAVDPLAGHGLTLAIEGGFRSAERSPLTEWYDELDASHSTQAEAMYSSASRVAPSREFWSRRGGVVLSA